MEMKASGQVELLTPTPITMVGPIEEVTVAQTSVQTKGGKPDAQRQFADRRDKPDA